MVTWCSVWRHGAKQRTQVHHKKPLQVGNGRAEVEKADAAMAPDEKALLSKAIRALRDGTLML